MKPVNIYDGDAVISRIYAGERMDGVLECLEQSSRSEGRPVYVVCDGNVRDKAVTLINAAEGRSYGFVFRGLLPIIATEQGKVMSTVLDIAGWLLENGADRDALLLAVGGGITTDMAGFAASIYKRGIGFACVPTTLLAQVDAAIGGKTGVNFDSYKNMLGVIRQPEFTYLCPEVLETLSLRDMLSGASELLKSFIIEDDGNYAKAVNFLSGLRKAGDSAEFLRENKRTFAELICGAASVKAGVVSRDQFENGERRKLNLGHTFAHSIERNARTAGLDITHGEAVAIGIVLAARLSERTGIAEPGLAARIESDFAFSGLPGASPFSLDELVPAMAKDKKAEGGIVHFVLIEKIGKVTIENLSVEEAAALLKK